MAKKTTLTQLKAIYDTHSRSFYNLSSSVGKDEKSRAIESMKRTGLALIEAIQNGTTKSCAELLPMAESMIDRSTQTIDGFKL